MPHICMDEVMMFIYGLPFIGVLWVGIKARWRAWRANKK